MADTQSFPQLRPKSPIKHNTLLQAREPDKQWDVTCSYCEVYNEVIYDLLQPNSGPLDLRQVAPLPVTGHLMRLLHDGGQLQFPGWTIEGESLAGRSAAEAGCICAAVLPEAKKQILKTVQPRFSHQKAANDCLWLKKHL